MAGWCKLNEKILSLFILSKVQRKFSIFYMFRDDLKICLLFVNCYKTIFVILRTNSGLFMTSKGVEIARINMMDNDFYLNGDSLCHLSFNPKETKNGIITLITIITKFSNFCVFLIWL